MGALPKNKISRVERGKRRRGNMPKLKKDLNSVTPRHKQGFMAEFLRFIGVESAPATAKATPAKTVKAAPAATAAQAGQKSQVTKAVRTPKSTPAKVTRKTQHKG